MPTKTKPKLREVLARLKAYNDRHDKDFDVVPGWDGVTVEAMTDNAVLLPIGGENYWLPFSQLRATLQDDLYASAWIINEKGLA